ncbi:multicopper oxidase domain-containing protein [Methylomarinum sp. Ch1-1]|uniref:Multicopper oxidase CueO n=1 Tax=Methylomarinum roseum TaxID=3067653 RepID=A0AAU7NSN5_9GAMM
MKKTMDIQRRRLLKYTGVTVAAAVSHPVLVSAKTAAMKNQPSPNFNPDAEIELKMDSVRIPIFDGKPTRIWKISGNVMKGNKNVLGDIPGTYLAPTIHLHKGQKVRIYLRNNLPAESILHWHGLHVPADMDGNPMYAIHHGQTYVYEFEILNRAGTYWYHAHTHGVTANQVYSGLAGLFIVSDDEEQALELPSGQYDIPLVIQDRSFDRNNQLRYISHMMQRMQGFLGDRIFVNGEPDFKLPVETRAYRLRVLNGSNSRIYKLAWDDGSPFTVIGVDGGLLERPQRYPYLMLGPAERRELWVDFSDYKVGSELTLRSIPFSASGHMMGGGMMGGHRGGMMGGGMGGGRMMGGALPLGGDYPLFKVKVVKQSQGHQRLPERLTTIEPLHYKEAANADHPRRITLSMRHMSALLNGRSYKMNDVRADEVIPVNTLQVIEFDNGFHHGMHGMMAMPHPMHLHGEQFQVIKREVNSRHRRGYDTVEAGLVDSGWKDTVLVMPGEKVTVLKPFNDFKGLFMYHCHNLEHEDMGMMRDFLIK